MAKVRVEKLSNRTLFIGEAYKSLARALEVQLELKQAGLAPSLEIRAGFYVVSACVELRALPAREEV